MPDWIRRAPWAGMRPVSRTEGATSRRLFSTWISHVEKSLRTRFLWAFFATGQHIRRIIGQFILLANKDAEIDHLQEESSLALSAILGTSNYADFRRGQPRPDAPAAAGGQRRWCVARLPVALSPDGSQRPE